MAIDFDLGADLQALQARIRTFIADDIIPLESDPRRTPHGPTEELRRELTTNGTAETGASGSRCLQQMSLLSGWVPGIPLFIGWTVASGKGFITQVAMANGYGSSETGMTAPFG